MTKMTKMTKMAENKAAIGLRALGAISLLLQQHKNMEIADFIQTEIINFQNT